MDEGLPLSNNTVELTARQASHPPAAEPELT
jgi:hypothetical protein